MSRAQSSADLVAGSAGADPVAGSAAASIGLGGWGVAGRLVCLCWGGACYVACCFCPPPPPRLVAFCHRVMAVASVA